ncbi:MAG: type II secretion system protein GspM [Proteobacteria bacterium]|nr:type II secretion system protein GspM [Pseudomonadota bacterium]
MRHYWNLACNKVDVMSLRERAMLFGIAVLLLVFVINATLFDPLLNRQKTLSAGIAQQQQETRVLQAQIQAILQARSADEHSPMRARIQALRLQLQQSDSFLQSRRDRLVAPSKMAGLLEQVLRNDDKLHLVELKTLPVSLLIEPKPDAKVLASPAQQIYKHGVQITVRGGYLDLLRYLTALEKMPTQMFWGEVSLSVTVYPDAVMILTVYTLSLDKTWLTV